MDIKCYGIKERYSIEDNYKAIFFNHKTLRFKLKPDWPMNELKYPEFYDVKITDKCLGNCPWCYQDSTPNKRHFKDIVSKFKDYFWPMSENRRPFQIAIGGGEPTEHPDFLRLLELSHNLGIVPNYTTNGMNIAENTGWSANIILATKKYCGGVALSAHPHLNKYWQKSLKLLSAIGIKTNLHVIISDKRSVNRFVKLFNEWNLLIDYFVLLPHEAMGRATQKKNDFDYLFSELKKFKDVSKISYGANFYESLKNQSWLDLSLYPPEMFSKYLDMSDMKLYRSSFNLKEVN